MTIEARIADRRDYRDLVRIRAEWLDRFVADHPAPERWSPAGARVPELEDEYLLAKHLPRPDRLDPDTLARQNDCWAALATKDGKALGYILWRIDLEKRGLEICTNTPRVVEGPDLAEPGSTLVDLLLHHAREQNLKQVTVRLQGFPGEVGPLVELYHDHGFAGDLRWQMVSRQFDLDPGTHRLTFRSAADIGLDAFFEAEVISGQAASPEESKEDCEISQKMWLSVEPGTDWFVGYEAGEVVGTVRTAVTATGVGVLDAISVAAEHRGRGLGRELLARGVASLRGRTDVVWLDVDHDNVPALRLYEWAGFKLLQRHGTLTTEPALDQQSILD